MRLGQVLRFWLVGILRVAASGDCPIELHPPRVVVRYGDPASANCTVSTDHNGMGWVAQVGDTDLTEGVQFLTWEVKSLTVWDTKPQCYVNPKEKRQCKKLLSVTVYKPPDSVSVSSENSTDSMEEGSQHLLNCEILNIAPVRSLTVKWYKGDTLVHGNSNQIIEGGESGEVKRPVNVSSTLLIINNRSDDRAQYRCGTELDLGAEGPQPPLEVKSEPFRITVLYPPYFLNVSAETLKVCAGEKVSLNCTAEGNPRPEYTWSTTPSQPKLMNPAVLVFSDPKPGTYTCMASNMLGNVTQQFTIECNRTSIVSVVIIVLVVVILLFICISVIMLKLRQK